MPKSVKKYQPPLHIPLPFEQAVKGLMAVDPKKLPSKKAKAKAAKKGKANRGDRAKGRP
ncbi:MAG: hypothetical protein ACR2FY_03405 [Pirellulaceae bacterium]